ncbi:RNA-directed DNA polymerase, eukaryota, reverse transcriptase zinc-binding domain protein [Tanacetum coccineum]|uniref:RNA-directed DNA polymerase, eukaryota, reverse transcriptase zinc-binding domain protein n=1 Tax=Tanacetum coccineum TaxID=301880 RepID=A0ABQ5AF02_9ASTR
MNKAEERKKEEAKQSMENNDFVQVKNRRKPSNHVKQLVKNVENNQGNKKNNVVYRQVIKEKESKEECMDGSNKENSINNGDKVNRGDNSDETGSVEKENVTIEEQNDVYEVLTGSASKLAKNDLKASYANVLNVSRGCRIMVGWNTDRIKCRVIHASDQAMLCLVEVLTTHEISFCTFIHAKTMGNLRRKLWVDLSAYKSISNNNPWVILGDINVCLNIDDHSEGLGAHVVFLPHRISDHNPAVLTVSKALKSTKKSFRFANYFADKEEFCHLIKENWNAKIEGFAMFKLVKKLKAMKLVMNTLNWQNGNLVDNVKRLKKELGEIQLKIDKNPHDKLLKENSYFKSKVWPGVLG